MDQKSLRKALGALKDSAKVGLAKVNSNYKELDIAVVKATNHVETLPKEKYISSIFSAISASRPRADVAYCINALAKRLAKTQNWVVAVKTLIVIHRALREVDATFREELINYTRTRGHMLNLSHFKDRSSPNGWHYSSWLRNYALYLEERLECFHVLQYDVETDQARAADLDTVELLEHLPALQQLLSRLLACQPEGAVVYNNVIRYALTIVASESIKIYNAINGCSLNLVDKFFEMRRHDALRALEIYRKSGYQAQRLSGFYEVCKGLGLEKEKKFIMIEQPSLCFITAMEEYVMNTGNTLPADTCVPMMTIEDKIVDSDNEKAEAIAASAPPEPNANETANDSVVKQTEVADLLGLDAFSFSQGTAKLEENNAQALAIVTSNDTLDSTSTFDLTSETTGWELALVSAASSNGTAMAESKLAGGLDKLTLDSLYDEANSKRTRVNGNNYHLGKVAPNPFEDPQFSQDPLYASVSVAAPTNVQMATMAQQQPFMMQAQQPQQQLLMHQDRSNPFGSPFGPF